MCVEVRRQLPGIGSLSHHMGSGDLTQAVSGKHLCPLSHLIGPCLEFLILLLPSLECWITHAHHNNQFDLSPSPNILFCLFCFYFFQCWGGTVVEYIIHAYIIIYYIIIYISQGVAA